jgi:deoxycytidylate deaminase
MLFSFSPALIQLSLFILATALRYLHWDDYFMCLAFLSAQRSKDPSKQVGAVIVGPNKVVLGIGYNGFPR